MGAFSTHLPPFLQPSQSWSHLTEPPSYARLPFRVHQYHLLTSQEVRRSKALSPRLCFCIMATLILTELGCMRLCLFSAKTQSMKQSSEKWDSRAQQNVHSLSFTLPDCVHHSGDINSVSYNFECLTCSQFMQLLL